MEEHPVKLFVMDRGFVVVGRAFIHPSLAFHWRMEPGRTVRRWGTTNGLAELANGPTSETILDAAVFRSIPFRAIIEIMDMEEEEWAGHLVLRPRPPKRQR